MPAHGIGYHRRMNPVFITGGTGYLGVPLIKALLAKGYAVHARCVRNRCNACRTARCR